MAKKRANKPNRKFKLFSSIGSKITLILLCMGAASASVGVLVSLVFGQISDGMGHLTDEKLPALEVSKQLISASSDTKDSMTSILLVDSENAMEKVEKSTESSLLRLQELIAQLPVELQEQLEEQRLNAEKTLKELITARKANFRNEQWIGAQITEMQKLSSAVQTLLNELAVEASTNLKSGGEKTISGIDATFSDLVDNKFAALQSLLEARAEINLLSGTTFALSNSSSSSTRSILTDLSRAASERLNDIIATLESSEEVALDITKLQEAAEVFSKAMAQGQGRLSQNQSAVLAARRDVDVELSTAVDDMVFTLIIAAEEASSENHTVIENLLTNEVGFLNKLLEINAAISAFQMAALNVVVAPGVFETHSATGGLAAASSELKKFLDFKDGVLFKDLSGLIALADPKQGLPAFKTASLQSTASARRESVATAKAVQEISSFAAQIGQQSMSDIATMAHGISKDIHQNQQWVQMLLAGSAGILLLAILLTRVLILSPLRKISATTERLAEGDLAEVKGFEKSSDEIHRIARALAIFRDSLVERQELAEATEKERAARNAEQKAAVTAIGEGLERLSAGDLSRPINAAMSDGYGKLKDDFNSAQENLRHALSEVVSSVSSIHTGAAGIGEATRQLSHRTESQAATLEETAAALDQMTASVRSSADSAKNVESAMQEAKREAEESGEVVNSAVAAMTEIDNSSGQISQIVNVIDDIAFQTNLLALNAGVEAARAGESGKGFAVVASEVRALAQRSAESAKEIKNLINESSEHVERGVELVGKTGDALTSILERFSQVSNLVSGIAEVTAEQSAGLNEINLGITQLDRVTQQNASMVEETTDAGQMLNADADRMAELTGQFNIGSNDNDWGTEHHSASDETGEAA